MRKKLLISVCIVFGLISNIHATEEKAVQTLSLKQQKLVIISSLTATGNLIALKTQLNAGLQAGLTVNEIKEAIVHLYAYCGFPRSIRGLQTLMAVIEERKTKGIKDNWGKQATPVKDDKSKYERGKLVLEKLTGITQDGPKTGYAAFAPEIEIFLKEHLFADIFERDVLSFVDRELVTVSVLSSIGGVEPMLNSHFSICLNIGLTANQLQHFVSIIKTEIGKKEAIDAEQVLNQVIKRQKATEK